MKRITFFCMKGLETFIDPIVNALDKSDDYVVNKQYLVMNAPDLKQRMADAIQWGDIIWFEWANEMAIGGTNEKIFPMIEKRKVIVRLHSYEALSDTPLQVVWKNVDRLVYVAPHIRDIVNDYLLEPDVKTIIIPNGVSLNKFRPAQKRASLFDIAWVGFINHKKNPSMMLIIMDILVKSDNRFKLHVAGAFQDRRFEIYLKHMIKEMKLQDNVIFYGHVTDVNKWLNDKHTLLSTSIHEGHNYVIMEAMAKGIIPVIHRFKGADSLYRSTWLFNTVQEAVKRIHDAQYVNRDGLRDYINEHGWTFSNQMKQIREVIDD